MGSFTRTNGLNCTVATLYNLNANAFLITVKNAAASARDLRAEDDAVDETVEMIVKEEIARLKMELKNELLLKKRKK